MRRTSITTSSSVRPVRRDLLALRRDSPSELDRFMIAMYRLQDEGRVFYRRIAGMHGGGFGTSNEHDNAVMQRKAKLDTEQTVPGPNGQEKDGEKQEELTGSKWPEEMPNVDRETLPKNLSYLGHGFCWHGKIPFLPWHRGMMIEFERILQMYDPAKASCRFSRPLAAHYWAWDDWDGRKMPDLLSDHVYNIITNDYECAGFPEGHRLRNPLRCSHVPALPEHQLKEQFPSELPFTTRNPKFDTEAGADGFFPEDGSTYKDRILRSVSDPNWNQFATTAYGSNGSIEEPHNRVHVIIGGKTDDDIDGAMNTMQSAYDPVFWLHHSNIERLYCSWQRTWLKGKMPAEGDEGIDPQSIPSREQLRMVLYPWTKPTLMMPPPASSDEPGKSSDDNEIHRASSSNKASSHGDAPPYAWSHCTPTGEDRDATFADLFDPANVHYDYDTYVQGGMDHSALPTLRGIAIGRPRKIMLTANIRPMRGGIFILRHKGREVARQAILSFVGSTCARCAQKKNMRVLFDVSGVDCLKPEIFCSTKDELVLRIDRGNGKQVTIEPVEYEVDYAMNSQDRSSKQHNDNGNQPAADCASGAAKGAEKAGEVLARSEDQDKAEDILEAHDALTKPVCYGKAHHGLRSDQGQLNMRVLVFDDDLIDAVRKAASTNDEVQSHCNSIEVIAASTCDEGTCDANVVVLRTIIDGPGTPWAWTSHKKPGKSHPAFRDMPCAVFSKLPDDIVCLFVDFAVPSDALVHVVAHLLGHAQGRGHERGGTMCALLAGEAPASPKSTSTSGKSDG